MENVVRSTQYNEARKGIKRHTGEKDKIKLILFANDISRNLQGIYKVKKKKRSFL